MAVPEECSILAFKFSGPFLWTIQKSILAKLEYGIEWTVIGTVQMAFYLLLMQNLLLKMLYAEWYTTC